MLHDNQFSIKLLFNNLSKPLYIFKVYIIIDELNYNKLQDFYFNILNTDNNITLLINNY